MIISEKELVMKKYKQTISELAEEIEHAKKCASEPWGGEVWFSKTALKIANVSPEEISKKFCKCNDGFLFTSG